MLFRLSQKDKSAPVARVVMAVAGLHRLPLAWEKRMGKNIRVKNSIDFHLIIS
jgi:hypothetical protein